MCSQLKKYQQGSEARHCTSQNVKELCLWSFNLKKKLISNNKPIGYYFIMISNQACAHYSFSLIFFLLPKSVLSIESSQRKWILIKICVHGHGFTWPWYPWLLDTWISLTVTLAEDEGMSEPQWGSVSSPTQIPSEKRAEASFTHMCGFVKPSVSILLSRSQAGFCSLTADHTSRSQFLSEYTEKLFMLRCFDLGVEYETSLVTRLQTSIWLTCNKNCGVCIMHPNPEDHAVSSIYNLFHYHNLTFVNPVHMRLFYLKKKLQKHIFYICEVN